MRIALPVREGRISPVFDTARTLLLVDSGVGEAPVRRQEELRDVFPPSRAANLVELGVEVLVCGAISRALASMVAGCGIQVVPFVSGDVEEVLSAYTSGRLRVPEYADRFRMPGCWGRRGRFGRGWGGGRRRW